MASEVGAVQCLPLSGFVNLVCRHLVGLRREMVRCKAVGAQSETNIEMPCTPTPQVGLPPTIPVLERYKSAAHDLHRAAPVVSRINPAIVKYLDLYQLNTLGILDLPSTQFMFQFLYAYTRKERSTLSVPDEKD
jgi:hypothetical protein